MSITFGFDKFGFLPPDMEGLTSVYRSLDKNFNKLQTKGQFFENVAKSFISASAGTQAFLLPSGSQATTDYLVIKTDSSANTVVITPKAPDLIQGSATYTLTNQYDVVWLTWYNGIWYPQGGASLVAFLATLLSSPHTWTGAQTFGVGTLLAAMDQVRVTNVADQVIATSTRTVLTFDTEDYDNNALHSTSSNTSRLTCPVSGLYHIFGQITFTASAAGNIRLSDIFFNNTAMLAQGSATPNAAARGFPNVSTQYRMTVGDYVELRAFQDTGGNLNVQGSTSAGDHYAPVFGMVRLSS